MNFPELEPNDNNAGAQLVNCVANNDTITGTTTGSSTTTPGAASADTFRVTTCATAPGIYRNRFATSTTTATFNTVTLRGLSQSAGVINTTADATTFQTANGTGSVAVPRNTQWYSFGAAADVYFRVTGSATTTAAYTATFSQAAVAPIVLVGSLNPGPITISRATGNTADTDFWVYDSSFNPVATFGIDDSSPANTMTRTFAAGTYYLAVSNANSANNLSSLVPGETFLSGNVMPFPGTWANSSTLTVVNLNMSFSDGVSTLIATAAKPTAFDSAFIQFTVAVTPPANDLCANATAITGSGTLLGNTSLASNDAPVVSCDAGGAASRDVWYSFTAGATGGTLALDTCTTTAIDSVLTVFDVCGGMELACNDDCGGSPCAATASCVGPLTLAPNQVVKIRVADKGLTGGAFTLNRTYVPVPANDLCANATAATGTVTVTGTTVLATNDAPVVSCDIGGAASRDVWYSYTAGPTGGSLLVDSCTTTAIDSVLTVYDVCGGTELACNDDCGGAPCAATASCLGPIVLTPNQVVKVRVADKGLTAGAFTVHFIYTAAPPPNDDCSGAILVAIPSATAGSTAAPALAELAPFLNSTCTGPGSNESSQNLVVNSPGVWYRVNSPTARTIYADTLTAGYDTSITVFSSCASATCVTMNDDIQGSPFHSKVAWQAAAGQDYFILVHGFGATDTGSFTLNVTADATPANDNCSAATLIAGCSGSLGGTLVGATGQNSDLTSALLASCSARATFFDVWYSYTAPSTGTLTLATCGTNDTVLSVHTACPVFLNPGAAGNQLAPTSSSCNDNGPVGCTPGSQVAVAVTAGTNYLIRVATAGAASINAGGGQPFTLTWSIPDTTPPSIVCPGTGPTVAADALCAALIPDVTGLVTASDNCGTVTLTQSPVAGTSVGLGVTPVTVTATDGALLTNSCVINVTVADLTGPTLVCGPDAAPVNADALCQAIVPDFTAGATASDSCSPPVTLSQSPLAGSTVTGAGVHNITVTAMDAAGNISTCINTMTLIDVDPPIVTAGSIASCYPSVSAAEAAAILATTVVDACGAPMTAATVGTCSAVITVTATDAGGNSASVMYNTTIDGTPPTITCPPNQTVASGVPIAVVIPAPTVADNCPGTVTFTNSFNGTSDASDTYPVGTTTVVWTATDACGNTATCNQTITVGLAAMKISQVYGAGGNLSSTHNADYIEIYNAGVVPQVLTGWSIQFASSTGGTWTGSNFLAGATVNPGQYFLIRGAVITAAGIGQVPALPAVDHTTTFALSATDAKIALCNTTTLLTGANPSGPTIVDLIGYGTATTHREPLIGGTAANNAVRCDASMATFRLGGGNQDTNNNFADFAQGHPSPRNTATALNAGLTPIGTALPTYGEEGNTIRLHATVIDNVTSARVLGATVTVNLTGLGGGAAVVMNDSGIGADQFGGDGLYSTSVVIPVAQPVGTVNLPMVASAGLASGGGYLAVEVRPTTTPDNDNCQTAAALTGAFPITVVANIQGATADTNPTRVAGTQTPANAWGAQGADRGVWYTVVGTGNSMTAETCAGAALDTVVQVFCGTCEGLTLVASSDDFGAGCTAGTSNSRATWCSTNGQLYYVSIGQFAGALTTVPGIVNPTLTITDSLVSCTTQLPCTTCPPNLAPTAITDLEAGFGVQANDGCSSAAFVFQNIAAPTGVPTTFKGTTRAWSANKDVDWYRFQATSDGNLEVTMTAQFMGLVQIVQLAPGGLCTPSTTVIAQSVVSTRCNSTSVIGGVTNGNWYAVVVLPLSIVLPTSANFFGGISPDGNSYNYFGSLALVAPPNDNCAAAVTVAAPSTTNGSTILATTDGTSSCDATGRDVWYTFTLAAATTVEIDASSAGIDTVVSLQSSCAGPEIACNDNGTCYVTGATDSSVGPIALAAGTYFVRVSDKGIGTGGAFTLRIRTVVNDDCCSAITVACPSSTTGTTTGASLEAAPINGLVCAGVGAAEIGGNFAINSAGVWYRINLPVTQTVYADTLTAAYDTSLTVLTGTCGGLTCVTVNDDVQAAPFHSKVGWVAQAGVDYFIVVHGFGATDVGAFTLNVTCDPTPANDNCAAAAPIAGATGSLGGTLVGATGETSDLTSQLLATCAPVYTHYDVWYAWTAPCAGNVTFGTCGTWDTVVSVHSACPVFLNPGATNNQIAGACNDDGVSVGCAPGSEVTLAVSAGQSLLVRVATAQPGNLLPGGGQPFTLTWSLPLTDTDGDMTPDCADGCPLNPALIAPALFFADLDLDGFGAGPGVLSCGGAGFVLNNTDCDDTDMAVNPGATEVCNGVDDDCDTFIDEGVQLTFYADADGDGFGNPASSTLACTAPPGFVTDNTDCNDGNIAVNPAATEVCNGIDDDCDTFIDEGVQLTFYADGDGDGFGAGAPTLACTAPPGFVANNTDCNDGNAAINPGATEVCDGQDNNCNGSTDEGFDLDGDGIANCFDNCPSISNPLQQDGDLDLIGDACDNCPTTSNPSQADCDGDTQGDACEGEPDCNFNSIPDSCDISSAFSADLNVNGVPDECETFVQYCFGDGPLNGGPDCPCSNNVAIGVKRGCVNSTGNGGGLAATGVASLSSDSVTLAGTTMAPASFSLFLQSPAFAGGGLGQLSFFDGLRCIGPSFIRLTTKQSVGGAASIGFPTTPVSVLGSIGAPGLQYYQVVYRNNAGFCNFLANSTNGVSILWVP